MKYTISETTRGKYNEMLEVLPPKYYKNGAFLVGEATDHKDGARYTGFLIIDGQEYEAGLFTVEQFKSFLELPDDEKLENKEDPEDPEILKELELLEIYDREAVEAYKEARLGSLDNFEEAYAGRFDSDSDFAYDLAEQLDCLPDKNAGWPLNCIDWEQAGREIMYDYTEQDGYYFINI